MVEKQGAFGCPWFWVTNREGKGEPFFGSDRYVAPLLDEAFYPIGASSRFHFMWEFLDLPWQDVKLLSKEEAVVAEKARL